MPDLSDIYQTKWPTNQTWATPEPEHPYGDIFTAAERSARLTGNMVSESASREEAYDRRIEAARQVSGVTLENPERGGYSIDARKAIRQEVIAGGMSPIDEQGGIPAYQKRIFDQKMTELQAKHPDLEFGGLDEEARALATQSAQDVSRATSQSGLNPILKFGAEFAGGAWGSRRDPLFLGSLFAGPTGAVGRTALARVASSALTQGLFNAGLTALEQPAVQAWHAKIGQETGVMPAVQDIGMAFALGMIPGAAIEGLKEAATPLRRLLAGRPEAGDVAKAGDALGPVEPSAAATMRAGEGSLAADKAILEESPSDPVQPPKQSRFNIEKTEVAGQEGDARAVEYFIRDAKTDEPAAKAYFEFSEDGKSADLVGVHGAVGGRFDAQDANTSRNSLGFSGMRELANHFIKDNPEVERITTNRISGARNEGHYDPDTSNELTFEVRNGKLQLVRSQTQLDHDMIGAALKLADDPSAPSPEAVAAVQPITAYHGSPYSFDAFDIGKIGEGEGNQSFGHGLYFAENPEVAAGYEKRLSADSYKLPDTQQAQAKYGKVLADADAEYERATQHLSDVLNSGGDQEAISQAQKEQGEAHRRAEARRADAAKEFPSGTVYQVRIHADRDMMLDYDKPLNEQSPKVQEALKPMGISERTLEGNRTVEDILRRLSRDQEEASKALSKAGIPGIKYLDQGSRGKPDALGRELQQTRDAIALVEKQTDSPTQADRLTNLKRDEASLAKDFEYASNPTRNFVIFDHNDVEITHKNGEPVQKPIALELQSRIEQANPKDTNEAMAAADEALNDFGRRDGMSELADRMRAAREAQDEETATWRESRGLTRGDDPDSDIVKYTDWKDIGGGFSVRESTSHGYQAIRTPEGDIVERGLNSKNEQFWEVETGKFSTRGVLENVENKLKSYFQSRNSGDVRNLVPMLDKNNNVVMRQESAVRSDGDIEATKADLIRSCK